MCAIKNKQEKILKGIANLLQSSLVEIENYASSNKECHYLLTVFDMFSKPGMSNSSEE